MKPAMQALIGATVALLLATAGQADVYYAINDGNWGVAANWSLTEGGAPAGNYPRATDTAHITGHTITANSTSGVLAGITYVHAGATLTEAFNVSSANDLYLDGGVFNQANYHFYPTGTEHYITIQSESTISNTGAGTSYLGSTTLGTWLGSATLHKTGAGKIEMRVGPNSDYTGLLSIDEGIIEYAGSFDRPHDKCDLYVANNAGVSTKNFTHTITHNLAGAGNWNTNNFGVYIGSGGVLSPGSANVATREAATFSFTTGTTGLRFLDGGEYRADVVSETLADEVTASSHVYIIAGATLRVRMWKPGADTNLGAGVDILDVTGTLQAGDFTNVVFEDNLGNPIPSGQDGTGWEDLTVNYYRGTGNDRVYITGFYLVPEPATMGLLAVGLAGLAVRRRRR